ncbi:unnamed protein product [Paramecium sonneborni]|uniref:Importin subunit alpha n=1 Tax=Paramecium sonneborni TaxID=65129 RepID=A0A8S1RND9_9CILI|nr:unnamed protein product [Paramecium sonneborni]
MSDQERNINQISDKNIENLTKLIPDSLPDEMKQALKSSVENLIKEEAELSSIEEYVSKMNSDDIIISYYGLNRCRKLLSYTNLAQPTESLIEMILQANVLIKISDIAKNNSVPLLKYEALWIICNIGCGTQKQIQKIIDNDGINILFLALESEYDQIIELGVWALANISGDNIQFRDMLINKGIVQPLIRLAQIYMSGNFQTFKTIVWAISNLAKGKPTTTMYKKELILILTEIIMNIDQDDELLIDAIWGLSYLSEDDIYFNLFIQTGVILKLSQLLHQQKQTLIIPSLRILGNILTGNEEQTNQVLYTGILQIFDNLLKQNLNKKIRKEICWSLSNIAAGTPHQVKQIIKNDSLLKSIFRQLDSRIPEITKEIAFFLSNTAIYAESQDLDYLVLSYGFIQKLAMLLDSEDKTVIQTSLEGFYEFLNKIIKDQRIQVYKQLIIDSNIIEKVEIQQNHQSSVVYEKANKILELLEPEFHQDDI